MVDVAYEQVTKYWKCQDDCKSGIYLSRLDRDDELRLYVCMYA